MNTLDIKHRDHFKLTIALKDKIIFEAELHNNDIQFHLDNNPLALTRYFLLDGDRNRIEHILKQAGIVASTDTIAITDYSEAKKVYKIYLYVAAFVVLLFVIAIVIIDYAKG